MPTTPTLIAGRYRLGEALGAGGMGRVWLARDEILDRDVAIKQIVLPALAAGDHEAVRKRTLREARAGARLSHHGVVQVYDVLEAEGQPWIVMEYVPSRSLQEVIRMEGPLEPSRVARIGLDVLAALRAAHRAGVLHRDVKPTNVLLADDGRVVLTDFGIATIEGDGLVTGSNLVVGSPGYMSPERAQHGTAGPASDLWSLGATLYAAVEGHAPYERATLMETLTALAVDEPAEAPSAGVLRPVLEGLLRKDPASRIDAAETERRLWIAATDGGVPHPEQQSPEERTRQAAEPEPLPAPAEPATGTAPVRPRRTNRGIRRALAVAAAVLALASAAWLVTRPDPDSPARTSRPPVTEGTTLPGTGATTGPGTADTTPPGASAPATGAPSAAPTASPAPARSGRKRPALPAGWIDYRDRTGFSVYVPKGWNRSREGTMVYFRDPRSGRVLGIDQTTRPASNPVADWRGQASYRVQRGDFPGYHEIRIVSVRYWLKAADWEFTFDGRRRQHVNNRGFVVSKSQAYGIWWQTADAEWSAARPDLQLIFDSFRPKS
ncbi:MAG TPA: serine/threonine-protein kinase [Actinoplanes sp.]|nr:serine/threonine-protein kinase [Actinoplanes sp.]